MATPATLFTVSAPSGAGKTSLVRALAESMTHVQVSVSHTTRAIRPGEQDGVDYHFVSQDAFASMRAEGEFLEQAQVFTNFYGTSKTWVAQTLAAGVDVILEIDWQGAAQVRRLLPEAVSVFVLPPSRETLHQRLRGRGQDSETVIEARMAEARNEISHYVECQYLIVNDRFEQALADFQAVVHAERLKLVRQAANYQSLLTSLLS